MKCTLKVLRLLDLPMISFRHINHEQFDDLLRYNGGHRGASRVLGVTPTQLNTWHRTASTPQCALRLLWLLTPEGAALLDHEMNGRLVCLGQLNQALRIALARAESETVRLRSSYQAQIEHLKTENRVLRSLISNPGLSKELGRLSAELQTIADVLPDRGECETTMALASDKVASTTP